MSAAEHRLICPWCVAEGERSTIREKWGAVTCMGWEPYYDEDGAYHAHDPNGSGLWFECSRGHSWSPASDGCPSCGWGSKPARLHPAPPVTRRPDQETP